MADANYEQETKMLQDEALVMQQLEKNRATAEKLLQNPDKMEHFLGRLEVKLSHIPKVGGILSDIPVLISLVKAYIDKRYVEIPIGSIIAIICALIYLLNQFDLIPDVIPGLGLIDDAAVLAVAYKLVHDDVAEYKQWRNDLKSNNLL